MPTLTIHHQIPISAQEWAGPAVSFDQWIPEGEADILTRVKDCVSARLYADRTCVMSLEPVTDELISSWTNISVRCFIVDVEVRDVPDELAKFVYEERNSSKEVHGSLAPGDPRYEPLAAEYRKLGETVLDAALGIYNRALSLARNHKGQYWLPLRPVNYDLLPSCNNEFNARVRSESFDWVRWCPPGITSITLHVSGRHVSISRNDWADVRQFVAGSSRADIVLELLANADLFLNIGQRRSAIIEATSALELAITRFSQSPNLDRLPQHFRDREPGGLKKSIEHLGFSTSLRYLLPLAVPDLDPTVHESCIQAADIRNNVVHNGQRDIKEGQLRPLLGDVRKCCSKITSSTVVPVAPQPRQPETTPASK